MGDNQPHRKLVKHYHEPGDFHELTFSCYRRMKLLTNDTWRGYLARSIDAAAAAEEFLLVAFVFMPEHVHLLVYPSRPDADAESISRFLAHVKRSSSVQVKGGLVAARSRLLDRLTIRERPDRRVFRFWQEGPGFDRNLNTPAAVLASIDYFHRNPVTRGLVKQAADWRWSSARWFLSDGQHIDPALPKLHRLPSALGN
jgi:putative transposase